MRKFAESDVVVPVRHRFLLVEGTAIFTALWVSHSLYPPFSVLLTIPGISAKISTPGYLPGRSSHQLRERILCALIGTAPPLVRLECLGIAAEGVAHGAPQGIGV